MHVLTITEGIADTRFGDWSVRCFIDADFHYGYWVSQLFVEGLLGEKLVQGETNKFAITKEMANALIEEGSTPYTKRFIK